jgi:hypothetical protein
MSKKVIRLTESELKRYIQKIISEQSTGDFTTIGRFGTSDSKGLVKRGFIVKGGVATLKSKNVVVKPSKKGWAVYQGGTLKFDLPHDDCDVQLDKLIGYNSLQGRFINEQGGPIPDSSFETNINGDTTTAPVQKSKPQPKPHPFGLLISNLKYQLAQSGLKHSGNNTFVGKVGRNNVSVVLSNKGITASKKPVVPPSITDDKGMGLLSQPLVMDYKMINATTFKKQLFDYFNK